MTTRPIEATVDTQPDDSPVHVSSRARFEILGAVLLGLFLSALDQTIVGPILPKIVTELHGVDYYTWVVTAYLLTSTVTVPIYGKLSDLFGRKPMLMIGIGLFLFGSALSGLSQTMWQLIAFRAIQGLGAGALFPISLAVIGDLFTPRERGKYQGLFGAVFGIAFLVGPGLGGTISDNFSWHWVFYVNLPIGLIALGVIAWLLPTVRRPGASRNIDYAGVATFAAAIVPILIGLTNAENGDWGSPGVWGLLVLGTVGIAAATALWKGLRHRAASSGDAMSPVISSVTTSDAARAMGPAATWGSSLKRCSRVGTAMPITAAQVTPPVIPPRMQRTTVT